MLSHYALDKAPARGLEERPSATSQTLVCAGDIEINLAHQHVTRGGETVRLSRKEWALLEVLVRNAGQLLPHRLLLREVWGDHYGEEHNYLHTYISRLRSKLEPEPAAPRYLLTEPHAGYRFRLPAAADLTGPAWRQRVRRRRLRR